MIIGDDKDIRHIACSLGSLDAVATGLEDLSNTMTSVCVDTLSCG